MNTPGHSRDTLFMDCALADTTSLRCINHAARTPRGPLRLRLVNSQSLTHAHVTTLRTVSSAATELSVAVEGTLFGDSLVEHLVKVIAGLTISLDVSKAGTGLNDARLQQMTRGSTVVGLNVRGQRAVTSAAPFALSLTELDASRGCGIGDSGLMEVTRLVKLDASGNSQISSVEPCSSTLTELDASGKDCGIGDLGLAKVTQLVKLNARNNKKLTSVAPFASSLTELDSRGDCGIDDAGLAEATQVVKLNARNNTRLTSVAPFASSLTDLDASYRCGINDDGLAQATRLIRLNSAGNRRVTSVVSFASSLTELDASGRDCGIADDGILDAMQLVKLSARNNTRLTSVAPFASTLTILDASWDCGVGDKGLTEATHLVTLEAAGNRRITSIAPFALTLTELNASWGCGIGDDGLAEATQLVKVAVDGNAGIEAMPRWIDAPSKLSHDAPPRATDDRGHYLTERQLTVGRRGTPHHPRWDIEDGSAEDACLFAPLWEGKTLVSNSVSDETTPATTTPLLVLTEAGKVTSDADTAAKSVGDSVAYDRVLGQVADFYAVQNPDLVARSGRAAARIVQSYAERYGMLADALNFKYLGQLPEHGDLLPSSPAFAALLGGLVLADDTMSDEHVAHELRQFFERHDPLRAGDVPRLVKLYAGEYGALYDSINAAYFDLQPIDRQNSGAAQPPHRSDWPDLDIDAGLVRTMLGEGASGTVYKAYSRRMGAFVAEKHTKPTVPDALDRLEREAVAMREFADCPEIVRCLSFERQPSSNTGVIYMELMDGGSLEDLVRKVGPQWEERCRPWVQNMLLALKRLHSVELVHRDVKPANVLLTADGRAKLSDLGLAKDVVNTVHSDGDPKGTLQYLAPELAMVTDERGLEYTPACDVWSLGCTWLRLLTGKPPWAGVIDVNTMLPEMMQAVGFACRLHTFPDKRPTIPACLSQEAKDLLDRMLRRDPAERIAIEGLLQSTYFARSCPPSDCEQREDFETRRSSADVGANNTDGSTSTILSLCDVSSGYSS